MRRQSTPRVGHWVVRLVSAAVCVATCTALARAADRSGVGYTQLAAELGASMPSGAGVSVSQIEALSSNGVMPVSTDFAGKTITPMSSNTTYSWHATTVGTYFYGNSGSIAPGITSIDVYEANNWLYLGMLKTNTTFEPGVELNRIQNNSWIGGTGTQSTDQEMLRRFDYMVHRDNVVAVVGTNNGSSNPLPNLLAHSYNSITVGLSNGGHAVGPTTFDTAGRVKPDIVAPESLTSWAAGDVSGAAALLIQTAAGTPALNNGGNAEVVKALLLAGATKSQFASWDRTPTRPLDERFGAGQLNVYNSYHVLAAGQHAYSASSDAAAMGWDFATTSTSQTRTYFFDVSATQPLKEFSAILTWDRKITDGSPGPNWGNPQASLANLDLKLYSASGYTLETLQDSSVSTVDNVEHIYRTLMPGRYALEVSTAAANTDFGLAWYSRAATPGDFNLDDSVDLQDFGILKDNFGSTNAAWSTGDCTGDGLVDLQDFGILKSYFGATAALTASGAPAVGESDPSAVPEPTVLALLAACAPALMRRRSRRA